MVLNPPRADSQPRVPIKPIASGLTQPLRVGTTRAPLKSGHHQPQESLEILRGVVYNKIRRHAYDVGQLKRRTEENRPMKLFNQISRQTVCGLVLGMVMLASTAMAADPTNAPPKPDLLATCPICGDKLADKPHPYYFTYEGQEVGLCCKVCKKDFDKDPARYMKMIREADKKGKN
jgi:YHS domain-containing protein